MADPRYTTQSHTIRRAHRRYESFAYRMRRLWILHLAVKIHLLWGFLILVTGDLTTGITAIATTRQVLGSSLRVAIVYLIAGLLSWVAMQLSVSIHALPHRKGEPPLPANFSFCHTLTNGAIVKFR